MILNKDTPCELFKIRRPRWKKRTVGIAAHRVGTHNEIQITARAKNGRLYYPGSYYASGELIRSCETQTLQPTGIVLYLVPISALERLERGTKSNEGLIIGE